MDMPRLRAAIGSLLFLVIAPGTIVGLVPWWLTGWAVHDWPQPYATPLRLAGAVLIVLGVPALLHAFARFVLEGIGTPAPVAPPEHLVVGGLYRYVRNPIYIALIATIVGQALALAQPGLLPYAVVRPRSWWLSSTSTRSRRSASSSAPSTMPTARRCRAGGRAPNPGSHRTKLRTKSDRQ